MIGPDAAIRVDGVHKKFCRNLRLSMVYGMRDVLRGLVGRPEDSSVLRKDEFWAVEDVGFELKRGEAFGVMGLNGSGKSTLLRLMTGIFPPDKGRIEIRGRVGALIAVGAGFHPHMSGRENVFLNGTILGMKRREIEAKYASIVDFADIGDFIDAPVASYSSGMKVRLGFAIAIHAPIEILIADEILAVGDVFFKKKCFEKVAELKKNGVTVVFVSHSLYNLQSTCSRGLVLNAGRPVLVGGIDECIKIYANFADAGNPREVRSEGEWRSTAGVGNALFSDVRVYQEGGDPASADIEYGKNIVIEFGYRLRERKHDDYQLRIGIKNAEGQNVQKLVVHERALSGAGPYANERIAALGAGGRVRARLVAPKLFPQVFKLDLGIKSMDIGVLEGGLFGDVRFRVVEPRDLRLYFEYGHASVVEFDYDVDVRTDTAVTPSASRGAAFAAG